MQTVPVFAYLVPILVLFGFGPVSAMIATIIYAMPPMVRITMLALKQVPGEVIDLGNMVGCTTRQMTWRVMVPSAMPGLMVGVNQVIMLSLNMVIIASMIGAGGLGYDVLASLRRLDIGAGIEAGVGIVVLAIALDRLSQAFADRTPAERHDDAPAPLWRRYPYSFVCISIAIVTCLLGYVWGWLQAWPEAWSMTTGDFWSELVKYININFFDELEALKNALLLNVLIPVKRFLLGVPWPVAMLLLGLAGYSLSGVRLGDPVCRAVPFHRRRRPVGQGHGHRLSLRHLGCHRLPDRHAHRYPRCRTRARLACCSGRHRYSADPALLRLSDAGGHAVPRRRLYRPGCRRRLRPGTGHSLHRPRHSTGRPATHRGRHRLRLHTGVNCCARSNSSWRCRKSCSASTRPSCWPSPCSSLPHWSAPANLARKSISPSPRRDTGRGIVAGLCVAFIAIIADRLITAGARRAKTSLGLE